MKSLHSSAVLTRRSTREGSSVGGYYDGEKRYYDEVSEKTVVKIFTSDCYASTEPGEVLVTILGSCISACIRDPIAGVGGMNHFLLPGNAAMAKDFEHANEATRFGVFAMEQLINELIKHGGRRERFEIKLFGGGNVSGATAKIGDKNVAFIRAFLAEEELPIASEHLGGTLPRRIHYYPDSGRVMMRQLKRKEDLRIVEEEKTYARKLESKPVEGKAELF